MDAVLGPKPPHLHIQTTAPFSAARASSCSTPRAFHLRAALRSPTLMSQERPKSPVSVQTLLLRAALHTPATQLPPKLLLQSVGGAGSIPMPLSPAPRVSKIIQRKRLHSLGRRGVADGRWMGRIHAPRGAPSLRRPAHTAAEMHGETNSPVNSPVASGTWRRCH